MQSHFTLYADERGLLSDLSGEPVREIDYDTEYLFYWEEDVQYKCFAKDIPGKTTIYFVISNTLVANEKTAERWRIQSVQALINFILPMSDFRLNHTVN